MKKILLMLAGMVAICGCSESPELYNGSAVDSTEKFKVSAIFSATEKPVAAVYSANPDTRITVKDPNAADQWNYTWEIGDQVSAWHIYSDYKGGDYFVYTYGNKRATVSDGDILDEGDSVNLTFNFDSDIPKDNKCVFIVGKSSYSWDGSSAIFYLDEQDGALNSDNGTTSVVPMISEKVTLSEPSKAITPKLYHVGSIMDLTLSCTNVPAYWDDDLYLDAVVVSGLNSQAVVHYDSYTRVDENCDFMTLSAKNVITASIKDGDITVADLRNGGQRVYLSILPTEITEGGSVDVTLRFSNGTGYTYTKTFDQGAQIERAKVYPITIEADLSSNIDYYLYSVDDKEVKYDYSKAQSYKLYVAENLAALAALTNSGRLDTELGNTFTLARTITIPDGVNWTPIGYNSETEFQGVFDGAGNSIWNYNFSCIDEVDDCQIKFASAGLFGYVTGENTVIKDLKVVNGHSNMNVVDVGTNAAILVGSLRKGATLLNCGCDSDCSVTLGLKGGAVGGLVGDVDLRSANILNCYNHGSVTASVSSSYEVNIGGICGAIGGLGATITNCYNSGEVTIVNTTNYNKGALVGAYGDRVTFDSCYYLTDCAGEGILAYGATSTVSGYDSVHTTSMIKEGLQSQDFVDDLNSLVSEITGADSWTYKSGGYPVLY